MNCIQTFRQYKLVQLISGAATAVIFMVAAPLSAQLPKSGSETPVHAPTSHGEHYPACAIDAAGNFVVAHTILDSGANVGVGMQRFNRKGEPIGDQIVPHADMAPMQDDAAIAMADDGRFVVVWDELAGGNSDVYYALYSAAGSLVSGPARVNASAANQQKNPRVSMNRSTGEFVVAFAGGSDQYVYYRRYNASGAPLDANEVLVNTGTEAATPSVAFSANGTFIVAWEGNHDGGVNWEACFQRYQFGDSSATALGGITVASNSDVTNVDVACSDDGQFVLAWVAGLPASQTDPKNLVFRRYDTAGTAVTGVTTFKPSAFSGTGTTSIPRIRVSMENDEDFMLTWLHDNDSYVRFYNADGSAKDAETLVHTDPAGPQIRPSVAVTPDGTRAVVAWTGEGTGDDYGAYFQRYAVPNQVPTNIALDNTTVAENVAAGTAVGNFSTVDGDVMQSHTYSLVEGEGSGDNSQFEIAGNTLKVSASPDYETKSSYAIRVRSTDSEGGTFEKAFTITVTDKDEDAPNSSPAITDSTIAGTNQVVVNFTANDGDGGGVASTSLWVATNTAPVFADSGLAPKTGTSGSFTYTVPADGTYSFFTKSTDNAGNVQPDPPATGYASVTVNIEANSDFTLPVQATSQDCLFPMTNDLNVLLSFNNATPGTEVTVSRTAPIAEVPTYFKHPEFLLGEALNITYNGPAGFSADLQWNFDATNKPADTEINKVMQFDGGTEPAATHDVTVTGNLIQINGLTGFSTFYAGSSVAVPVSLSSFNVE